VSPSTSATLGPDVVPEPSTIVLDTPSAHPVEVGAAVTLSAHVTPVRASGTVRFFDGNAAVGAPVRVVRGAARWVTSDLAAGPHAVTASFTPDTPTLAAASSLAESVVVRTPAAITVPNVSLSVTPAVRVVAGTDLVLSATVGPEGAVGDVLFFDGDAQIGAAVPVVAGVAQAHTATLTAGVHRVSARFIPPDRRWLPLTSAWSSVTITKPADATTSIGLTVSPQRVVRRGTPLTLSVATFPSTSSGSVTFFDGDLALGDPVAVVGGQVDIDVRTLSPGTHQLTAAFAPDGSGRPSTSGDVTMSVVATTTSRAATRTTLVMPPGATVRFGIPVLATAFVSTTSPGRIDLLDAGVVVGGGFVRDGRWTDTLTLPVGSHALVARFVSFDPSTVAGSTSSTVPLKVERAPAAVTSTSLVAGQGGSAQPGQSMTLTATVLPREARGSVTILDRGRPVALVTVAGGLASWATVAASGSHNFTARFTPSDPRYWTSAKSVAASVIVPAVTTHAVTPSPAAVAAGSPSPLPQSPELSPVALESSMSTAATTNVAIVKTGSDVADLVAIAVLSLALGVGFLALSGWLGPRRRTAPERSNASYRRHAR
jgi:hypothetical protein